MKLADLLASRGIQWPRMAIFRFLLLKLLQADQVADVHSQQRHLVAKNVNFRFLLLKIIQADQLADLPPGGDIQWPRMAIFRFLLLKLLQADQVADLPSPSRGIQWPRMSIFRFLLLKVIIGRSTGRSMPALGRGFQWPSIAILDFNYSNAYRQINWQIYPPCKRHVVAKNGNFQISIVKAHIGR